MMVEVRRRTDIASRQIAAARQLANRSLYAVLLAAEETVVGGVTPAERDSWIKKEDAARALIAGTASTAQMQMLAIEAGLTGETTTLLAATIIAKADAYTMLAPVIAGVRRKYEGQIAAATSGFEVIVASAGAELQAAFAP